jgi:tetratricopeptide (TPR) repeat protein
LTLEAAYEGLLRRKRRALHRRVAEVLERRFPDRVEEQLGLLAHHWERAGEAERAVPYLHRAGERAAGQFANVEAVAYFSRALGMLPEENVQRYPLLLARERVYELQVARQAQSGDLATLERLAEVIGDKAKQAEVAVRRARYSIRVGEHDQAISAARTAVRLAQAAEAVRSEAMAYWEWGLALFSQRESEAARPYLEQALALAQDTGLRQVEARILHTLGSVLQDLGHGERGMACYDQALRICRQTGDRRREGEALRDVGWQLLWRANWNEGEGYLRRALSISREMGNRGNEGWALLCLGIVSYLQGHYARAQSTLEQSLRICREIRDWYYETEALYNLGLVYTALVDYATARDCLEQALAICREESFRLGEGWAFINLGLVCHLQGNDASARVYYERALHIGRELADWQVKAKALMYTGLLSHHLGDDHAARDYSQQALNVIGNLDLGWAVDLQYVSAVLGHAMAGLGYPVEAADAYRQTLTMYRERGQHHLAVEPLAGLARVALAQGNMTGAVAHAGEILDYMEDHPALHGTLEPLRIYLTCYRVLLANGDPRAEKILDAAHRLLQERAATIEDQELRRSYLENVAAHREIVTLWEDALRPKAKRNT